MQSLKKEGEKDGHRKKQLTEQKKKLEKTDNELRIKKKELEHKKTARKNIENKIMLRRKTWGYLNVNYLKSIRMFRSVLRRGALRFIKTAVSVASHRWGHGRNTAVSCIFI